MTIGNGPMERRERLQKNGEIKEGGREEQTGYTLCCSHRTYLISRKRMLSLG